MSENVMSARRKVVIGILSLITIGCICTGIYFLTRKSDKNKQNSPFDTFDASDNKSKGIGLLIFGIFLFVITVFIAISPNNDSYPSSYPYSYPYPYSDVGYNLDPYPYPYPYPYEDQYITIPVTYRPKQFPYPYPF
jgi:hypothetical protein